MSQPTGSGYINLGQYLDANRASIPNTANTLVARDNKSAADAKWLADRAAGQAYDAHQLARNSDATTLPDYANAQFKAAQATDSFNGLTDPNASNPLANQLADAYGDRGAYRSFDQGLLQASPEAQGAFTTAQSGHKGLNDYLNQQVTAGYNAGAPPIYSTPGQTWKKPPAPDPIDRVKNPKSGGAQSIGGTF